jgi:hypothetical protein
MALTVKEFETTLRRVLKEETRRLATRADVESLRSSVDSLTKTVASYLGEGRTVDSPVSSASSRNSA